MILRELLEKLDHFHGANITRNWTVDTLKCGSPDMDVRRVAVTMFPTVEVIRRASAEGIQLLIAHEPIFYHDKETVDPADPVMSAKKALLEHSGLAVYRYHDHPHWMSPDLIDEGTIRAAGIPGKITGAPFWAVTVFEMDRPMSARVFAETMERNLHTRHIRIAGAMDGLGKRVVFACGTPGHITECLKNDDYDFIVTGEVCEWEMAEYARDFGALYGKKALFVLGHEVSERAGMQELVRLMQEAFPELRISYLDSGDVYHFTD